MRNSTKNSRGAMADPIKHAYEFGPFRIDTIERLLFRGDEMVSLTPKAVDTLLALVSNHGRVLGKEELMKLIWPDSFVEEGGLARNISILRKVFEEGDSELQYIETLPKRGYRFLASVKDILPSDSAASAAAPLPQLTRDPVSLRKAWRGLKWTLVGMLVLAIIGLGYFRLAQPKAP